MVGELDQAARLAVADEECRCARFALPGRVEWNAQHVDDLIRVLAEIRYVTELHRFSGGTVFEFRHPALGWLEFVLPSAERSRISRFLAEQESAWQRYRG